MSITLDQRAPPFSSQPQARRRGPIPSRLISHPGQSLPKRDPLMPSNGCLMTLIKGVNVLMEPFEDRPNLYEDQFSRFIRKDPGWRPVRARVCVCVRGSGLQNTTLHL